LSNIATELIHTNKPCPNAEKLGITKSLFIISLFMMKKFKRECWEMIGKGTDILHNIL